MSAWTYWTSNLPYFPAVLYFAASNVLYMRQAAWGHLSNNATFYIVFSLLTLAAATLVNIVGLDVGKWLHNVGALAMWIPAVDRDRAWARSPGTATAPQHRSRCTP